MIDEFGEKLKKNISLNYPLIYIKGNDVIRLRLKLNSICAQMKIELDIGGTIEAIRAVFYDSNESEKKVLLFTGSEKVLREPEITAIINDIVLNDKKVYIVILSDIVDIPINLRPYSAVLGMPSMTANEIRGILETNGIGGDIDNIVNSMSELTSFEITHIIKAAIEAAKQNNKTILQNLKDEIGEKKHNFFNKDFLTFVDVKKEDEDLLGGFKRLKADIDSKYKYIFNDINRAEKNNVPIPKGFMLVGIPGCGKSLAAKITAAKLKIPLLKMDFGRIMNKYVGESEANLFSALRTAEASAPCVLWLDEFEKSIISFSDSGADGNISNRLLGIFLNWLQEKKSPVFTIATVNNIDKMPPELLRRGRFDEIYKVDTPEPEAIQEIFKVQLKKYNITCFDQSAIKKFCGQLRGYSGADIEQIVSTVKQKTFSFYRSIQIQDFYDAMNDVKSVEVVMHDQTHAIRKIFEKYNFRSVE